MRKAIVYLEFDEAWHPIIKTTNYLERSFKEINGKIYYVGVFPNFYSAERIFFLEILELNYKFSGEESFYVN